MEAPLQGFRAANPRVVVDEVTLPPAPGDAFTALLTGRTCSLIPSADVTRDAQEHLAFGAGPHVCVGLHLARLEMAALFRALAERVRRFHIKEEVRSVHNVLRGFTKLVVSVE